VLLKEVPDAGGLVLAANNLPGVVRLLTADELAVPVKINTAVISFIQLLRARQHHLQMHLMAPPVFSATQMI
jgi:cell shape-determining protein MreC